MTPHFIAADNPAQTPVNNITSATPDNVANPVFISPDLMFHREKSLQACRPSI